jgi:hypothetical protein
MNAAQHRSPRPAVWYVIRRITSETADVLKLIASARNGRDEVSHGAGVAAVRLHRRSDAGAAFRMRSPGACAGREAASPQQRRDHCSYRNSDNAAAIMRTSGPLLLRECKRSGA